MDETPTPQKFLRWPPPGLERVQGDLWRVASRGAIAGGLLVLPLLYVLAYEQEVASLGPFADAWWVTLFLAMVGLVFTMDALGTVRRVSQRAASALERGYDLRTVAYVLADLRKDMGFLLQGGRHFSVMDPKERAVVAYLRVVAVMFFATAGVWMSGVLGILLLAASRGLVGQTAVWTVTILPAAAFYAFGAVATGLEDSRVRRARKEWFKQPWAQDLVADEIEGWRRDLNEVSVPGLQGRVNAARGPILRITGILGVALGVFVAVPVFTLMSTSAIGPILASVAIPAANRAQERAAQVEAFRGYNLATDGGVTPAEAGDLLHVLLFVGNEDPTADGEREPVRRITEPWLSDLGGGNPVGAEPHRWSEAIFPAVIADPSTGLLEYLAGVAAHPAHADFARLARAAQIDVARARWTDPLPAGTNLASLPIPRFSGIREGAWAHLGLAAHEYASGRPDGAEQAIREVISVGLLLGDQGPTLIDNLIGHVIAQGGAQALQSFYEVSGQEEEAERLNQLEAAASRAASRMHTSLPVGVEGSLRMIPALVRDTSAVRGLRWELFASLTTLTPCLNVQSMVFGPDDDYERFVNEAHDLLVRWPSEEGLFEVVKGGYFRAADDADKSFVGRILGVSMRSGPGTCGDIIARIQSLGAMM